MSGPLRIPARLAEAQDGEPGRRAWLDELPERVGELADRWRLRTEDPYRPGGSSALVLPARDTAGAPLVLKLGWRHEEAEHEADGLLVWNGDGAVRCLRAETTGQTSALLLERCVPGTELAAAVPEAEQDEIIAGLLERLWAHRPPPGHRFRPLEQMCDSWADSFARRVDASPDPGIDREAIALLRGLPRSAGRAVLLCTDLHAENVLAATREPWLAIDPKPYLGDPAYDVVQHMLNCARLPLGPVRLAHRLADRLGLDRSRVARWLFARCVQESRQCPSLRDVAERLRTAI